MQIRVKPRPPSSLLSTSPSLQPQHEMISLLLFIPNGWLNVAMPSGWTVYLFCCQMYPNVTLPEVKCPGGAVESKPSHDVTEQDLLVSLPTKAHVSELHSVSLKLSLWTDSGGE